MLMFFRLSSDAGGSRVEGYLMMMVMGIGMNPFIHSS